MLKQAIYFLLFISLSACVTEHEPVAGDLNYLEDLKNDTSIKYARRFAVAENNYCKAIYLYGNRNVQDTSAIFIILKDSSLPSPALPKTYFLKDTCKRIASLSSIYTTMLCELRELNHVIAIENIDYYNNPQVIKKFSEGQLAELSKGPSPDIEKTISVSPCIVFTFGMGDPGKDVDAKIVQAGIPLVVTVDHLEETPLARAEWIKFFAAFTGKEVLADSIFNAIEKNYHELKKVASTALKKPKVFSEIKLGETWYVPAGKSFAGTLFNDACADYPWKDNTETGSLHLSFEEVYNKAKDADYWLNMALVTSKNELLAQEKRYAQFNAFKTGHLYNNIKHVNSKGYSDYWETGILYPNRILHDLVSIFHPELKPQLKNDLYYYKKLE